MTERFCPNNFSDSFQYPFLWFAHSIDDLNSVISSYRVSSMVKYLRQVHLSSTHFRWTPITTVLIALAFREIYCLERNANFLFEICHRPFFECFVRHVMEILVVKTWITRTSSISIWRTVRILEWTNWVICAEKCWFAYVMAIVSNSSRHNCEDTLLRGSVCFIIIELWKDSFIVYFKALYGA